VSGLRAALMAELGPPVARSTRGWSTCQDPDRRRALLEQLRAIADSEFRQVFVVSHTDDVVEHCDLRIDVSRGEDGASTAVGPRR